MGKRRKEANKREIEIIISDNRKPWASKKGIDWENLDQEVMAAVKKLLNLEDKL